MQIDLSNFPKIILPHFHQIVTTNCRYIFCVGGAGSGKSFSIVQTILYHILSRWHIKTKTLFLRKWRVNVRESVWALLLEQLEMFGLMDLVKSINKSTYELTFKNGSQIICRGLDDSHKLKSIVGVSTVFCEEILGDGTTLDDFRQVDLRLRGTLGVKFRIFLACNPITKFSWPYKTFIENQHPNTLVHHSNYKNNTHLDAEYISNLKQLEKTDLHYYQVYALGEWGSPSGLIFNNWEIVSEYQEQESQAIGIDFGYIHPMSVIKAGRVDDGFILDELYYETKQTIADLITWMKANIDKSFMIYGDSSRPEAIEQISRSGYQIYPTKKGPGSVLEGIDFLKQHRLYVTAQSKNLIKELNSYSWREDRQGNQLQEPIKSHDDCVDAVRYCCVEHWSKPAMECKLYV